ncbi:DgyrCDS6723 [Dimorphilus gyrociliatus]|uniref:DgyrCDS6723 n=1 Tax=Dimorphilus gyrociliatus TaxID=2664684 RepID=A0A7I8VRL0_9ANNE|nr:DgyrCDS6723 [Dimorphilus gyrociliatus]
MNINDLPNEILSIIFSYLNVKNRYYNRFVCKKWNTLLAALLGDDGWIIIHKDINVPKVSNRYNIALYDADININQLLPYANRVKGLKIACAINWESLVNFLKNIKELEHLDLTSCSASSFPNIPLHHLKILHIGSLCSFDLGKVLSKASSLKHLTFHQSHYNSSVDNFIRNSKSLEGVHFERIVEENRDLINLFENGINHLKVFKQSGTLTNAFLPYSNEVLEKLTISGTGLTGDLSLMLLFKLASQLKFLKLATPGLRIDWNILKKVTQLKELHISNNSGELDKSLSSLTLLKCLDVASFSTITSSTLKILRTNCSLLSHLNISGTSNINNEDVNELVKCLPKLETLFLDHCFSLTFQCLIDVHIFCRNLRALSLQKLKKDETALEDVAKLKKLEYLNIAFCKLSNSWFQSTCYKLLTVIKLSHTNITDEGVLHLVKNSYRIREINLMATEITGDCLRYLITVHSLRVLDITSCENILEEVLNEVKDNNRLNHLFSSIPTPMALDCPCIALHQKSNVPFHKIFTIT